MYGKSEVYNSKYATILLHVILRLSRLQVNILILITTLLLFKCYFIFIQFLIHYSTDFENNNESNCLSNYLM